MALKSYDTQKMVEMKTIHSSSCPHCISILIGNAVWDIENNNKQSKLNNPSST
jgi:hypothetical protein